MKILIAVSIMLTTLLLPAQAVASESELRLKILPIDCVFEIINDGSGELRYITPEKCGELIEPEPGDDPTHPERNDENEHNLLHNRRPNDEITNVGNEPERDVRESGGSSEEKPTIKESDNTPTHIDDQSEPLSLARTHRWWLGFGVIIFAVIWFLLMITYVVCAWRKKNQAGNRQ